MNDRSFAVFIITHGRPNDVVTFTTLRKSGYTGRIYLLVDNEDETVATYVEKFGADNVIMFDKAKEAATTECGDTTGDRRSTVFARNASFEIARNLGLDYFLQFDDDYVEYKYRHNSNGVLHGLDIKRMDDVFTAMLDFLDETGVATVAFSQGGDHLGGASNFFRLKTKRKAMNSFFLRTNNPIEFIGRLNEDVNTYVVHGARGVVFITLMRLHLKQRHTQTSAGGMTATYLDSGTYLKSFYTVMMAPSCVSIITMGQTHRRLHHRIQWNNAVPKIIDQSYRKTKTETR